jgi:hypothetical protein
VSDEATPPEEPSPLGRFVAPGPPPSSLRGVERKAIRSAVDEAVARAQHLTGAVVSERTVRYFVDDSRLATLLERLQPRRPPSDDPVADGDPTSARDLDVRQTMAAVQTWLAVPGRSRDEVLARLVGDVTDTIVRSEATDPDEVEARVDLVLTMVEPLVGDHRVTDVVQAACDVAASRVTSWGMAHSAALAADLDDRRPNRSGTRTMVARLHTLGAVMAWFDQADQALPRLDIVARLAQSIASDAVGYAVRREEVPTAVADLIAGLCRIAALATPDDVELEGATASLRLRDGVVDIEPEVLLVASQMLPTMALGTGVRVGPVVGGLALASLAGAVHGDWTRCIVALVDAGVAAHRIGHHEGSAIACAAALWIAIGTGPVRPLASHRGSVPPALVHLSASLAADDPDDTSGLRAGLAGALDQIDGDLGSKLRSWVPTTAGIAAPSSSLEDVVQQVLARFGLEPPPHDRRARRTSTERRRFSGRPASDSPSIGPITLPWLEQVLASVVTVDARLRPALEVIGALADRRLDRQSTSAAVREEWRRLDRTDPAVLGPILPKYAPTRVRRVAPRLLSEALLALRAAESATEASS